MTGSRRIGLAVQGELGGSRRGLVADLAKDVGDGEVVRWVIGDPLCVYDIAWIGCVPVEAVEASSRRSLCIFDTEIESIAPLDYDHQQTTVA